MELVILKDVFGSWLKVPCIDNVGSCTYTDLCPLLSGITCPPSFDQQKVPCKCPFSKVRQVSSGEDREEPGSTGINKVEQGLARYDRLKISFRHLFVKTGKSQVIQGLTR